MSDETVTQWTGHARVVLDDKNPHTRMVSRRRG
jgi:hypothetical protein